MLNFRSTVKMGFLTFLILTTTDVAFSQATSSIQKSPAAAANKGPRHSKAGDAEDEARCFSWTRNVAEGGYAVAQLLLGSDYELGKGVPQDFAEAYFWYAVAAASGRLAAEEEDVANESRDDVAAHLTPVVLAARQEQVRKWSDLHHVAVSLGVRKTPSVRPGM
jgi:hypothetical protein